MLTHMSFAYITTEWGIDLQVEDVLSIILILPCVL